MRNILYSNLLTFQKVVATSYGWALAVACNVYTFFAPEKYAFTVVLVAVGLDAFFGIWAARKRGAFLLSILGRNTFAKVSAYCAALILLFMIEKMVHDGTFIGVRVAAAWAAVCEFWSMSAHVLIIWPEANFFRIMRRHLKGEIESKLGRDIDDILPEK